MSILHFPISYSQHASIYLSANGTLGPNADEVGILEAADRVLSSIKGDVTICTILAAFSADIIIDLCNLHASYASPGIACCCCRENVDGSNGCLFSSGQGARRRHKADSPKKSE
jgi:hypothetical protein